VGTGLQNRWQNPGQGFFKNPGSQVVSDLPCSQNPGPRWSLILGTGDRDRRPGPAPVASPVQNFLVKVTFRECELPFGVLGNSLGIPSTNFSCSCFFRNEEGLRTVEARSFLRRGRSQGRSTFPGLSEFVVPLSNVSKSLEGLLQMFSKTSRSIKRSQIKRLLHEGWIHGR
jgi:hypothetical protein